MVVVLGGDICTLSTRIYVVVDGGFWLGRRTNKDTCQKLARLKNHDMLFALV